MALKNKVVTNRWTAWASGSDTIGFWATRCFVKILGRCGKSACWMYLLLVEWMDGWERFMNPPTTGKTVGKGHLWTGFPPSFLKAERQKMTLPLEKSVPPIFPSLISGWRNSTISSTTELPANHQLETAQVSSLEPKGLHTVAQRKVLPKKHAKVAMPNPRKFQIHSAVLFAFKRWINKLRVHSVTSGRGNRHRLNNRLKSPEAFAAGPVQEF